MIRKAVIPAAGFGTRFLPASKAQPKEMLPILDVPTIQYVVEEAVASGIDDILIVTGRDKRPIEDHFDRSLELELFLAQRGKEDLLQLVRDISDMAQIHYVRQKEPLGLGHAISCARRHVGDAPFAVLLGDDVIRVPAGEKPCLRQMIDIYEEFGRPVLAVQRVAPHDVSAYGIVAPQPADRAGLYNVRDLVEKPQPGQAPSNLAVIGRYILDPAVFDILERQEPGVGGEIQLTDALRELNRVTPLLAYQFAGQRYDMGDKLGYLKATVEFGLSHPDVGEAFRLYLEELVGKGCGC